MMSNSSSYRKFGFLITSISFAMLLMFGSNPSSDVHAVSHNENSSNEQSLTRNLDGVQILVDPVTSNSNGIITLPMKITNEEGIPLTHVDWLIKIADPQGNDIFKSSTIHTHVGTEQLSFMPTIAGTYGVSVQVASLGPKMMGMDVPEMAQTRIFNSNDPMMGWQSDPNLFFGVRNTDFNLNVNQGTVSKAQQSLGITNQGIGKNNTTNDENLKVLNGSENGTKIEVAFSTDKDKIIVGEPVRLAFDIKNGVNGSNITHPDGLLAIKKGDAVILQTPLRDNPMMPMMGAFHGHTGQLELTTAFPTPGVYEVVLDVNSLPVSNYIFGTASATFDVDVVSSGQDQPASQLSNQSTSTELNTESLQVDMIGQEAPFYSPNTITVSEGSSVLFKNTDAILHTATSTNDEIGTVSPSPSDSFDTGLLMGNQEKLIEFEKEGTYNYFCTIHPFMQGTVIVTA